jgi:hypothetical protein
MFGKFYLHSNELNNAAKRSHEERAFQFVAFGCDQGGLLASGNDLAESIAEEFHDAFLGELLLEELLELVHLEDTVPVAHVDLELVQIFELFLDFADEADKEKVELLDAEGHDVVEGELDARVVDDLLHLVDVLDYFLMLLIIVKLFLDLLVNLLLDVVDVGLVRAALSPVVVEDFQQFLATGALVDLFLDVGKCALLDLNLSGQNNLSFSGNGVLDGIASIQTLEILVDGLFQVVLVLLLEIFLFLIVVVIQTSIEHIIGQVLLGHRFRQEIVGLQVMRVP